MAQRDVLMRQISEILSIPVVQSGVGSSVHNDFIDPLASAVLGDELAEAFHDKYRKIQAVIEALGGTYVMASPHERGVGHTSEGTSSGGGGTLTNLGLQTILDLLYTNGVPLLEASGDTRVDEAMDEEFSPAEILDKRVKRLQAVATRPNASSFRNAVRDAYGGKCCISGADAPAALEAAHISPYRGPDSDKVSNSLLLRADLHKLHDALLIAVSDVDLRVLVKPSVMNSNYANIAGITITEPRGVRLSGEALRYHRQRCGL